MDGHYRAPSLSVHLGFDSPLGSVALGGGAQQVHVAREVIASD